MTPNEAAREYVDTFKGRRDFTSPEARATLCPIPGCNQELRICPHDAPLLEQHLLAESRLAIAAGEALDAIASRTTQRGYVNGRLETDAELRARLQPVPIGGGLFDHKPIPIPRENAHTRVAESRLAIAAGEALDAIASRTTQRGYVNGRLETDAELRARLQPVPIGGGLFDHKPIPIPRENAHTRVAWFDRYLANDKQARKEAPLARGLLGYFPNACLHVAHVSFVANEQHNPGLPLQWAFDKSSDEPDCELRHMLDAMGAAAFDDDGLLHRAKKAWRALAELERYILANYPSAQPGASVTGFTRESASTKENK